MPGKTFILDDFTRDPVDGKLVNKLLNKKSLDWLGHAIVVAPFEAHTAIDYTAPVGATTALYYSLAFQLGKWDFVVQKADEWIEVSPVHAQYYQLTQRQKEELEAKIKSGLASVSQAIADMELLSHDERKYREFLDYFGITYKNHKFHEDKEPDEHMLRSIFIDQIDAHTGEGISMRSIVSRWPTLIVDFQRLSSNDLDPEKVKKKLDVPKSEAIILVTKNKLYNEWKNLFKPQLKTRYMRILELMNSRKKSIDEYREWLKPLIARHKMIEEGLSRSSVRKESRTSFIQTSGHGTSSATIVLWTWRDFIAPEIHKGGTERLGKEIFYKKIDPYDAWTKRNLIFNKDYGLIVKYPWITDEWVKEKKEELYQRKWLKENYLYYTFFIITFTRTNIRGADGSEIEDGIFDVNAVFMSQNILFAKLLDLLAKQEEFENYVNEMLGLPRHIEGTQPEFKESKLSKIKDSVLGTLADKFSLAFQFAKPPPYERDFEDRITKIYLREMAVGRYVPIVSFIKKKIGMGS